MNNAYKAITGLLVTTFAVESAAIPALADTLTQRGSTISLEPQTGSNNSPLESLSLEAIEENISVQSIAAPDLIDLPLAARSSQIGGISSTSTTSIAVQEDIPIQEEHESDSTSEIQFQPITIPAERHQIHTVQEYQDRSDDLSCTTIDAAISGWWEEKLYQRVEQAYRQIIKECPNREDAYLGLGNALSAQGWMEDAQSAYEMAININPNYADAYRGLGDVLRNLGEYDDAIEAFEEALQINPEYAEVHFSLGEALRILGAVNRAVESYQTAIQINPNYAYAYVALGDISKTQGDLEEAIHYYESAVRSDSQYIIGFIKLGQALSELEYFSEAISIYMKALEIESCNLDALYGLGNAYLAQGKILEAQQNYEKSSDCINSIQDRRVLSNPLNFLAQRDLLQTIISSRDLFISTSNGSLRLDGSNASVIITNSQGIPEISIENHVIPASTEEFTVLLSALTNPLISKNSLLNTGVNTQVTIESINLNKLEEEAKSNPNNVKAHTALAIAYFLKGEINSSIEVLEKAVILKRLERAEGVTLNNSDSPNEYENNELIDEFSFYLLGAYLIATGKRDEVLHILDKTYISHQEWGFIGYLYLAYFLEFLGRPSEAKLVIEHTYVQYLNNPYLLLARIFKAIDEEDYTNAQALLYRARAASTSIENYDIFLYYKYFICWAQRMIDSPSSLKFSDLVYDGIILEMIDFNEESYDESYEEGDLQQVDWLGCMESNQSHIEDLLNKLPYFLSGSNQGFLDSYISVFYNFSLCLFEDESLLSNLFTENLEQDQTGLTSELIKKFISYFLSYSVTYSGQDGHVNLDLLNKALQLDPENSIPIVLNALAR